MRPIGPLSSLNAHSQIGDTVQCSRCHYPYERGVRSDGPSVAALGSAALPSGAF
jgi:hypothetical protein